MGIVGQPCQCPFMVCVGRSVDCLVSFLLYVYTGESRLVFLVPFSLGCAVQGSPCESSWLIRVLPRGAMFQVGRIVVRSPHLYTTCKRVPTWRISILDSKANVWDMWRPDERLLSMISKSIAVRMRGTVSPDSLHVSRVRWFQSIKVTCSDVAFWIKNLCSGMLLDFPHAPPLCRGGGKKCVPGVAHCSFQHFTPS